MNALQAVILGLIQGLTEFLPVSSSGHLILGSYILKLPAPGLSFSVMLHLGTGFAVLVMLRQDIMWVFESIFLSREEARRKRALQLVGFIMLASIPAGLVGIFGEELLSQLFFSGGTASLGLIATGFILWFASKKEDVSRDDSEKSSRRRRYAVRKNEGADGMPSVTLKNSLFVGLSQAVAIIPGVSRSGITMATGLVKGVRREDAARFSFLLSIPAVFGAGLLEILSLKKTGVPFFSVTGVLGAFISFISGMFALKTVFRAVRHGKLASFSYYCWAAGVGSFLWLLFS